MQCKNIAPAAGSQADPADTPAAAPAVVPAAAPAAAPAVGVGVGSSCCFSGCSSCTRAHVRVHGRTRICMYTHICTSVHMYAYTSTHTRMWMYACTHASTPGTTAPQRQGEELIQTLEASHISPVQHNQPHLASSMLGLHCTHFLRLHYPLTPPPLFPIYPRTVHGPQQAAWFYCPTLIVVQSAHHALPHSAPSQLW